MKSRQLLNTADVVSAVTAALTVLAALPYELSDLQVFPPALKAPIAYAGVIATLILRVGRPFLKLIITKAEVVENLSQAPATVVITEPQATTITIEKQTNPLAQPNPTAINTQPPLPTTPP